MKSALLFLLSITIISCSQNQETTSEFSIFQEDVSIDSTSLGKLLQDSTLQKLNPKELEILTTTMPDTNNFYWLIENYVYLDSIKKAGQYEAYLNKLDIGMIKEIVSKKFKTIVIGDSITLVFWGLDFSSYEACPFTEGKVLFLSTLKNGKNSFCLPVSYSQHWSDAPVYNSLEASFTLNKNGFLKIKEREVIGDLDENEKLKESKKDKILEFDYKNGLFNRRL